MISIIDLRVLLVLGFLYYAYKLQYKKEKLNNTDKVLVISLFILLVIVIFLTIYFTNYYANEALYSSTSA